MHKYFSRKLRGKRLRGELKADMKIILKKRFKK